MSAFLTKLETELKEVERMEEALGIRESLAALNREDPAPSKLKGFEMFMLHLVFILGVH